MQKGKITISRQTGYNECLPISISIKDDTSGLKICDLEMSFENLAKVITGQASIECEIKYFIEKINIDKIGKKKIIKHINIPKSFLKYDENCKKELEILINSILLEPENKDFSLWNDGLNTQQKNGHTIILVKYE